TAKARRPETSKTARAVQQTPIVMLLRRGRRQASFVAPKHRAIRATGRVPPLIRSREATPGLRSRSTEIADLPTAREGHQTRGARAQRCWGGETARWCASGTSNRRVAQRWTTP